jgi:integrase
VRRVTSYRRHKPTGQAAVTIDGRDVYLGKWGTPASRREYERLVGEWLAGGRCLPEAGRGVTIAELARAYRDFAKVYYPKPGSQFRVRRALRVLRERYAHTLVEDFGPLALQSVRQQLVEAGGCRRYVNYLVDAIRRVFKWGVAQEIVPETVFRALTCVAGLRRGRTSAPEHAPVGPVADDVVDATLPCLSAVVADMVRFQRLTGARPGEVCIIRPSDVDTSGEVWLFRPESHKTDYAGRRRVIPIGPRAQSVLRE